MQAKNNKCKSLRAQKANISTKTTHGVESRILELENKTGGQKRKKGSKTDEVELSPRNINTKKQREVTP